MATLNLDWQRVNEARDTARRIAQDTKQQLERFTTVSVERALARLLGVDGVDGEDWPYPNIVVDHLLEAGLLEDGVFFWLTQAVAATGQTPQQLAEAIGRGEVDLRQLRPAEESRRREAGERLTRQALDKITAQRRLREERFASYGEGEGALIYVIVATGNIYEDITQAKAAARQGADIIAVIRTTGQSLLDHVPYGATTEGFGGTMATQENFRLMRDALDEVSAELGRYVRLCNYCSGLCMPEIAVMGALERLDVMLNDAFYGILFRDINMKRTLIDQHFSRQILSFAGIMINTGEDNFLTTSDAYAEAHTVLASQLMNEQLAKLAGLPDRQIGLGHAYEMDPAIESSFLYEWAQAQMSRQIFPNAAMKFMPPTKHMTGNIFQGTVQNALFNMVTTLTGQRIHLLGMLTEAIHTPFMADRALAIENARLIERAIHGLADELEFKAGGRLEERADLVLKKALQLLRETEEDGLFATLAKGKYAGVRRSPEGGRGLNGVVVKSENYENPFAADLIDLEVAP